MKLMTLELDARDMMMTRFLIFCKREIVFETIFWIAGTQNHVIRNFSLEVALIVPVIARAALLMKAL